MHVAALFSAWSEDEAKAFLNALKDSEVRIASSNGEVKRLVASGEVAFGLTDTDDANEALRDGAPVRVAIARALVTRPSAILLDEPLANLDVALKRELLELLRTVLSEADTAALYVTHDPREAVTLGAQLAVLDQGRIVQRGTLDELRATPATAFVRSVLEACGPAGLSNTTSS
jgi:ABC-type sugar transport system ATPase subunit